jgi:hypothetical protein
MNDYLSSVTPISHKRHTIHYDEIGFYNLLLKISITETKQFADVGDFSALFLVLTFTIQSWPEKMT